MIRLQGWGDEVGGLSVGLRVVAADVAFELLVKCVCILVDLDKARIKEIQSQD